MRHDTETGGPHPGPVLDGVGVPGKVRVLAQRVGHDSVTIDEEEHFIDAVDVLRLGGRLPDHHDSVPHPPEDGSRVGDADRADESDPRVVQERGGRTLERNEVVQVDVLVDERDHSTA
nr:hypothetical protein [Cellulomonas sp. 73-92]